MNWVKHSTAKFVWYIDRRLRTPGMEIESKLFQAEGCSVQFKLKGNISKYWDTHLLGLSIYVLNKQEIFGKFEFYVSRVAFGKVEMESHCSVPYEDRMSFEYVPVPSVHRSRNLVIMVEWIPDNFNKITRVDSFNMAHGFSLLQESGEFSDVDIETGDGTRFSVHKAIIATRSPVFYDMLKSDIIKVESECIKIEDFSTETIKHMITYMYTNRLPELSLNLAEELLKAAHKYKLEDLKEHCAVYLLLHIKESSADKLFSMGIKYQVEFLSVNVLQCLYGQLHYLKTIIQSMEDKGTPNTNSDD